MSPPYRLDRSLIRVAGADALEFLNNLLTQNVEALADTGVLYGALLTPQGKIIADMFIWADGDGVILDVDAARGAELLRRLTMYKLRAQVTLEDVSTASDVLWAPEAFEGAKRDPRLDALGWRALGTRSAASPGDAEYDAFRSTLGVPDLARDAAPEELFALEALLEELHGVDFQKGCFVGQENVSRMKRRATTRKKFCPVVVDGDAPSYGTPIRAGEAELGSIRTGASGRAIALLRLDRALEAAEKGEPLAAGAQPIRLDPPDWLILPQRDA